MLIKYLPIPPTICGLFHEWGYPKILLNNFIKFIRQYEIITQISIKTFLMICVINVFNMNPLVLEILTVSQTSTV